MGGVTQNFTPLPQYWTIAEILTSLRISRPTLWRLIRDGEFPAPVAISANRKVFPVEAVLRHLDRKKEEVSPKES
jgi:predicted DNA-binding transcriptional regulator AlpA